MPEQSRAQAPALRDRVDSDQRQKPQVARRVESSHLLGQDSKVAEDLIAAALGDQLSERCVIGPGAGGQPQGDRGEVLQYVRRAAIERPPAVGLGESWHIGGVLIGVRPEPPHDRVNSERKGERGDPAPPVRRLDDLN
jgi:hypothetical protein